MTASPLRIRVQGAMENALRGVWAEYPRECDRALDAIMVVIAESCDRRPDAESPDRLASQQVGGTGHPDQP